jgi:hypothetical protein
MAGLMLLASAACIYAYVVQPAEDLGLICTNSIQSLGTLGQGKTVITSERKNIIY